MDVKYNYICHWGGGGTHKHREKGMTSLLEADRLFGDRFKDSKRGTAGMNPKHAKSKPGYR